MKQLFGGLLLAVGVLIAGASGLCSLVFLGMGLAEGPDPYFFSSLGLVLMVGGIPFLMGIGLFLAGRALLRSARDENP